MWRWGARTHNARKVRVVSKLADDVPCVLVLAVGHETFDGELREFRPVHAFRSLRAHPGNVVEVAGEVPQLAEDVRVQIRDAPQFTPPPLVNLGVNTLKAARGREDKLSGSVSRSGRGGPGALP